MTNRIRRARSIALASVLLLAVTACSSDDVEDPDLDIGALVSTKTLTVEIDAPSLAAMQAQGQVIGVAREIVDGAGGVHDLTQWDVVRPLVPSTSISWTDEYLAYHGPGPVDVGVVITAASTTPISLGQALELAAGALSVSGQSGSSTSMEISVGAAESSGGVAVGLAANLSTGSGPAVLVAASVSAGETASFTPTDTVYLYVTQDETTDVVLDQIAVYRVDMSSADSVTVRYDSQSGFSVG